MAEPSYAQSGRNCQEPGHLSCVPLFHACLFLLRKHSKPFIRQEERRREERRREEKRGEEVGAGPAVGRHPLTEHSAWDMAFTENNQMPWQLIRVLKASCINTPSTRPRSRTQKETHPRARTHKTAQNRPTPFPDFKAGTPCEQTSSFSNLNILSTSQTRTHEVRLNEYITHTIARPGPGDGIHFYPAGSLQIAFE